jgi:hypothetical protein
MIQLQTIFQKWARKGIRPLSSGSSTTGGVYKQQKCLGLAIPKILLISRVSCKKFFIDVKINGYAQRMKVDSGCHDTIINSRVWRDMGEPDLINIKATRKSALGMDIPLKGKLFAQVEIAGNVHALPMPVTDEDLTRSLEYMKRKNYGAHPHQIAMDN